MKKQNLHTRVFTIIISFLACLSTVNAQSPAAIPYQAVARGASGNLISNQNISLRFTIHDGTAAGTVVYQETKTTTTNALGLFNVNIGQGTVVSGTFAGINWSGGAKFTQVEIDVAGGTSYIDIGTQQMMSVPYALYAASSGTTGSNQWTTNGNDIYNGNSGKVGIGTTSPEFKLSIDGDGGLLSKGTIFSGNALTTSGGGTRMIWYPKKAAFRAGSVYGSEWDDVNIGLYSTAMGNATTASGIVSVALGFSTIASDDYSTALGYLTTASGISSTAMGGSTTASGDYSLSSGYLTSASGMYATAMGRSTTASGNYSTAMGSYAGTSLKTGAFALGDNSTTTIINSSADNEFSSRFAGGYRLFSDAAASVANGLFFIGGKEGIGISSPEFKLSIDNDGGILAKGTIFSGTTLSTSGAGTRLIWYPKKAAFRTGSVYGSEWDDVNIGLYSTAMGNATTASGNVSIALGFSTIASNDYSTALGYLTTASGISSTAMGGSTTAGGDYSISSGYLTNASGMYATAMGRSTSASGNYSTAMGSYASTNAKNGAFSIGDNSTTTYMPSSANNEFSARFAGGYRLFSDAATTTVDGLFFIGGKLGIGTSTPNAVLQLSNAISNRKIVLYEAANNDNQFQGFGLNYGVLRYQVNNTGDDHVFYAGTSATTSSELMRIKGNGNVGIGNTAPTARLDIAGTVKIADGTQGAGKVLTSDANGLASWQLAIGGSGQWASSGNNIYNNNNGNVGIGTNNPQSKLHVFGADAYLWGLNLGFGNSNAIITTDAAKPLIFQQAGTEKMRMDASGNIGLGTSAPSAKLDIAGNVKIADGTQGVGKVLTSDANGLSSWQLPAGGSGLWTSSGNNIYNNNSGNVGIGNSSPNAPLQFSNSNQMRKIVMFETANNDNEFFGFGVNGGELGYHTGVNTDDHVFYTATSPTSSNELMRIKGNGNVGIGTNNPQSKLHVFGGDAFLWGLNLGFGNSNAIITTDAAKPLIIQQAGTEKMRIDASGNVGLGTSAPEFRLSLNNDGGIIAEGTYGSGTSLTTTGPGTRMIWYPKKAAFRAGRAYVDEWDDANIGDYSTAFGQNTRATGYASSAMGISTEATGEGSTAMGFLTHATGARSNAMGFQSTASGTNSIAMGSYTTASGEKSTAIGFDVSTNLKLGAFALGDASTFSHMNASADNEFSARFDGGYRLFSNAALTAGVTLASGGGSWTSVSDKNKKENFKQINTEEILQKVGALPVSNWNYKAQPATQRHIGCMAQDFYAAFRLDGQSDTTINSLDIDGVNMAAIQALKVRTDELMKSNNDLKAAVEELKNQKQVNTALSDELHTLKTALEKNGIITKDISASAINSK